MFRQFHVQILHQKRPLIGDLLNDLRRRLTRPVSGPCLDAAQDRRIAGLRILHFREEFETVRAVPVVPAPSSTKIIA